MNRKIVGIASVDIGPHVWPDKKALVEEYSLITGFAVWSGTFSMEMVEMKVGDITGIGTTAKSLYQAVGNTGNTAKMDMAVGRDMAHSLIRSNELDIGHRLQR